MNIVCVFITVVLKAWLICMPKAKAFWRISQCGWLVELTKNSKPKSVVLQKKVRFVVHKVLGVHGYDKDSQTMKFCVCMEAIWSCNTGQFDGELSPFSTNKASAEQWQPGYWILYWQSNTELMCRGLWRKLIFLSVTELYSQLGAAFVSPCAQSLWFQIWYPHSC